jgi:hypothetical protein
MRRRAAVRVPAAGLLPALFLGGLLVAAPFAGTTTGAIAASRPPGVIAHGTTARVAGATAPNAAQANAAQPKAAPAKPAPAKPAPARPAPAKPTLSTADLTLHIDSVAAALLAKFYLAIAALAVGIMLFAVIWLRGAQRRADRRQAKASVTWTDAFTLPTSTPPTSRSVRSPARAARASLRRPSPTASAQQG